MIFSIIGSFQLFNEPQLMQPLAPTVIDPDYTPNLYAYNLAFVASEYNYAAAVSFVLGIVILVGSYAFMFAANRRGPAMTTTMPHTGPQAAPAPTTRPGASGASPSP